MSYTGADKISIRRTVELESGNTLDLLRKAQERYKCVFYYDTAKKEITVFPLEAFEYKGVYFTDELNTGKPLLRGDSFEFCTRLIPIGAEGLKIDDINGGKSYVDNFDYSNKIITKVWKDERYTDIQSLKDDAIEKLKVLANPNRTYSLDVIDLAAVNSEYSHLAFNVGDKILLVDRNRNVKVEHQVARLVTYPDNPQKNKAELCATAKGFENIVQNLTGMIDGTNVVVNIQGRRISKLTLDIEAFTVELSNYYTKGETETYVGSQITAEAERVDIIVSEQTSRINHLTGEIETVGYNVSELSVTVGGFDTRIANAEGEASTLSQTVSGFDTRISDAEGQVSSMSQTIGGFDTRISNAEGQVSSLSQTVGGFEMRITETEDDLAALSLTVNNFETRISDAEGNISSLSQTASGFNTRITNAEGSIASLTLTLNGLETRITNAEGNISTVTQTADKINWLVASGASSSNFTITPRLISLMATNLNIEAYVTFTNLQNAGQTVINGGNITTGTINASLANITHINATNITVGTLDASQANITNLNASNIVTGTLNSQRLSSDVVLTTGAQTISGNKTFSGTTTVSGNISANLQTVTPTNLGYLSGSTSNIQSQINTINTNITTINTTLAGKQNTITGAATTIVTSNLTAGMVLVSDTSGKVSASSVSTTVLGYLSGVTSAVQTQLNGKQNSLPTGGSSSNFLRGDLTWQTIPSLPTGGTTAQFLQGGTTPSWTDFATTVRASAISTITLTNSALATTDTFQAGMGKLQAQINNARTVPTGGSAGQFLRQDLTWQTPPAQMPTGGTSGQFLRSNGTSAASWETIRQVPTGGTAGQFLRQDLTWQTPSVTIPTAITVNSISVSGTSSFIGTSTSRFVSGYFTTLYVGSGLISQQGPGNFLTMSATANDGVQLGGATGTSSVKIMGNTIRMQTTGQVDYMICDSTGIRIGGTAYTSQRIGFYNVTPIARTTGWANLTNTAWSTAERDRINAITTFLRSIGLTT